MGVDPAGGEALLPPEAVAAGTGEGDADEAPAAVDAEEARGGRRFRERRVPRERDESNLYVGYIPTSMSNDDVTTLFETTLGIKGAVQETSLIFDRTTREPKGYGFVKMWDARLAAEAVRRLHGFTIDGKRLAVRVARDPPARPLRGSRGGNGVGGGSHEAVAGSRGSGMPVPGVGVGPPLPFGMGPPSSPHSPPMWVNPYQFAPYWGSPDMGWYSPYPPAYAHSAGYSHVHAEGVPSMAPNGSVPSTFPPEGPLVGGVFSGNHPGQA